MTARSERIESIAQIIILLAIGGMAGAASFTHVHDWTMANMPARTGDWFGWANAVISELTPTAAGLEIRRRKRQNRPITYPLAVLIAAAVLSLSAQVARARPSLAGWLLAAVPALAFLALSKLILSRAGNTPAATPQPPAKDTAPSTTTTALPSGTGELLPTELLTGARMAAFTHRQATGNDITADTLASHLAIPDDLASTLLHALDDTTTPSPVTHVNGTALTGSRL